MTRMIERWFPCAEVSDNSANGWGSGNTESSLWVWFAKRPVAQSKAAVLTSLLPWPESEQEQRKLQTLVRTAMSGYKKAQDEIDKILTQAYGHRPRVLDPFSGRAMIPLEAGRLGADAFGVDYSPFATLGGSLLADLLYRDWTAEKPLPFSSKTTGGIRLIDDADVFLDEVGARYTTAMAEFYPQHGGRFPWGYFWASSLPCQECGNRFPLVGELHLRLPRPKKDDPGQSFYLDADSTTGKVSAVVHDGPPRGTPTRVLAGKNKYAADGRVAVCPFCGHVHTKDTHTRLSLDGERRDMLLLAADIADDETKIFREPTDIEFVAAERARKALAEEPPFGLLPARPDERIPGGNSRTIQSVNYGDNVYGDLFEDRQTLGLVRLARAINECSQDCLDAGLSADYVRALAGFATAAMMRKLRRSSRGARLQKAGRCQIGDIFVNQSAVSFSYDWFEGGLSDGPGSWQSLASQTITAMRNILLRAGSIPATIERGDATGVRFRAGSIDAVVTDPPYDDMIDYSDSSDMFYVWAKRAMQVADPSLAITAHPDGVQEKNSEIIVKRGGGPAGDHRTASHYDRMIARAFSEARRVVTHDGVVTIVFGHGDPEVWHRLLQAITVADLVMSASWPAKTEAGGAAAGSANIVTTLTMACRPAMPNRGDGRAGAVEMQIREEIARRVRDWERAGLAPTDMLMASAGPAMEIVGRYARILDSRAEPVEIDRYLVIARRAVQDAMAVDVDRHPLQSFDPRTRFALWWVRLFGRQLVAKSELRWQVLAADLAMGDVKDLVPGGSDGCQFVSSARFKTAITTDSPVIDIVLAMGKAQLDGLGAVGEILSLSGRDSEDPYLWAAMKFLVDRLPERDADAIGWTRILRNQSGVFSAAKSASAMQSAHEAQQPLF